MVGSETEPGTLLEAAREALERATVDEPLLPAERSYLAATATRLAAMVAELQGRRAEPTPKREPDPDALPRRPQRMYSRTEAARLVGCHPNSLLLWEQRGLLSPKRDWRGWRVYGRDDLARAMAVAAHLPLAEP
jgi:hypothetical protein